MATDQEPLRTRRSLEEEALKIFGSRESSGFRRWIQYWSASRERNAELLTRFESIVLADFSGKTVLDIGCGTGGLSEILSDRGAHYCGIDYHRHVIRFSEPTDRSHFVQGDGAILPFPESYFDFVFAFDIIEHLQGGRKHQREFLTEVRRVLSPLGMVFLTTPNFWYPYDAHSELYFPQFIPRLLRDSYIERRNPAFLEEHGSFKAIRLLTPAFLRSTLRDNGLSPLHELPCCLDSREYRRLHPIRGLLTLIGLGWYPHAEFWTILVRREARSKLRAKLRKNWFYEKNQPSQALLRDFSSRIDFDEGKYSHQLVSGWFWHEKDRRGFRWTERQAICYLQTQSEVRYLRISGYSPIPNHLLVDVDGLRVGEHAARGDQGFDLEFLLPFYSTANRILEVGIETTQIHRPHETGDHRDLGVMIFSLEVSA